MTIGYALADVAALIDYQLKGSIVTQSDESVGTMLFLPNKHVKDHLAELKGVTFQKPAAVKVYTALPTGFSIPHGAMAEVRIYQANFSEDGRQIEIRGLVELRRAGVLNTYAVDGFLLKDGNWVGQAELTTILVIPQS